MRLSAVIVAATLSSWSQEIAYAHKYVQLDYNLTLDNRSRDTVFLELFDDKPITTNNFLAYTNGGKYDGSFMHRLSANFVMQGGGFYPEYQAEPSLPNPKWSLKSTPDVEVDLDGNPATDNPTIQNEYSVGTTRSNIRGTIAMARQGGIVNSATSQWFVNYRDNSALDSVDGGFTVFAEVRGDGMSYFDALKSLQTSTIPGMVIGNLNQDNDNNGTRDAGPFGLNANDGVPLLFGLLNNLVIVEKAKQIDYYGGTGASKNLDIPAAGYAISTRDVFFDSGATFSGTGTLTIGTGRTLGVREGVAIGRNLVNSGILKPGIQNAAITVPSYTQNASGKLAIDIRGTTVDSHYDRLTVTGAAQLGGTLAVDLLNGFVPALGNSFTILSAGSITGDFANYDLAELPQSMFWTVQKSLTSIVLTARGGDYDHNGVVNHLDYSTWKSSYGNTGAAFSGGDGNGDGRVDAADFTIWRNNLGLVAYSNGGSGGIAPVPEPKAGILLVMAGALVVCGSSRRPTVR